jgi:hypothetical protein
MEEDWKEIKKKSNGTKKSTDDRKPNFSHNSRGGSYGWKNDSSELKKSKEFHNPNSQMFKPQSLNTNDGHNSIPKHNTRGGDYNDRGRGGYNKDRGRGGGGYKPKRQPEVFPDFKDSEEEEKFTVLKKEIPHIKMPGEIRRIAASIRIDGLADKMLTDEWIELQRDGWQYVKVITPDKEEEIPEDDEYDLQSIENKWGDYVLFKKIK